MKLIEIIFFLIIYVSNLIFSQVANLNDDRNLLEKIRKMRLMRVYEIKCRLGVCTDDFTPRGRLIERATYRNLLSSLKLVLSYFGFDFAFT